MCILSLHNCVFNAVWAEWGTIAQSSKAVYGWTDSTINMMVNYGNIGTAVATLPVAWLVDIKAYRRGWTGSNGGGRKGGERREVGAGEGRLIAIGQFLNGAGGAVTSVAPTVLSETWFSPTERNTATCVTLLFAPVGAAIAFVVEFCISLVLLVLVIVHFPNKPVLPPSKTASIKRLNFIDGIKAVFKKPVFWHIAMTFAIPMGVYGIFISRKPVFWHIAMTFAIPMGVYGIWITVLDVILHPFGVSQSEAGWLSFSGNFGAVIIGFILSRFSDILLRRTKAIMIPGFALAVAMFVIFLLMIQDVIKGEKVILDILCVGGSSLVGGLAPLYYELACECSYPVAEGTAAAILSLCMNLSGVVFVLITLIHGLGKSSLILFKQKALIMINFSICTCISK
ncbi:hypothetical protein FSP39_021816 [Pinctada imbricata]|uniref:Uncharacterized protein n=1 Tax=Pinctada imbricata TaxID=66713 RepID=A0AA88XUT2_PINIB|nr:hypothetical protein FSP39_021816 [Pinctada imbricata]